jgi:hypothetical protein
MTTASSEICSFFQHPLCQGIDNYAHRPIVSTNETRQDKTLETLKKSVRIGNGFVGTGGFFNLNAVAHLGKHIATITIVDRSVRVRDFWQKAEEIIRTSDDRHQVIEKIQTLLYKNAALYFQGGSSLSGLDNPRTVAEIEIESFQREIDQKLSWVSDTILFEKIKKIFGNYCFFFYQADLYDPKQVEDICRVLQGATISVDTIYLSNLGEYASWNMQHNQYIAAMKKLIAPETHVISAHFSTGIEGPMQFVRQKRDASIETFLFPEIADIPELAPDRTMAVCHSLFNLGCWIDEHRATLKTMSIVALGVAAVFFTRRVFAW